MKPTIRNVAKRAQVSVATVSRIINGQPGYTEDTRRKVLQVIEEMGYKPSAVARGLAMKKTFILGVLLPSVTGNFASILFGGIEHAAREANHSVLICKTGDNGQYTSQYLRILDEHHVSGILFVSETLKDEYAEILLKMEIPVILVATQSEFHPFPYIKVNDKQASYQATKYLSDRGHTTIGMISGMKDDPIAGIPRVEGFTRALQDAGLSCPEECIVYGNFAYHSGIEGMARLHKQYPDVTAVFAASDEMAAGALTYTHQQGINVPDEFSIIGYDDTQIAEMVYPPLTTVHQPIYEIGARAVSMVLEGREESVIMPYSITERASVKDLR
jgi:LacI family transcriptional regulator